MKCANCYTPLRGPYCFVCGQRNEPHVHSFWEFLREAAEGLTHAEPAAVAHALVAAVLLLLLYLPLSGWVEGTWIEEPLLVLVALSIPWYIFRALRRVHGQGRVVTFLKYCVLSVTYLACVALMVAITTLYTIVTL